MGFDALHVQNKTWRKGNMYNVSRSNKGCLNSDMMGLYVVDISLSSCIKANSCQETKDVTGPYCYVKFCLKLLLESWMVLDASRLNYMMAMLPRKIPWISTMLEPPWARTWAMVHTISKVPFAKDPTLRKVILFNRSIAISAKEKIYAQMVCAYKYIYIYIFFSRHASNAESQHWKGCLGAWHVGLYCSIIRRPQNCIVLEWIGFILCMTMQCMNIFIRFKYPLLTGSSNSTFSNVFGFGAIWFIGYLSQWITVRSSQYMSSQTNSPFVQIDSDGPNFPIRIKWICRLKSEFEHLCVRPPSVDKSGGYFQYLLQPSQLESLQFLT